MFQVYQDSIGTEEFDSFKEAAEYLINTMG